MPSSHVKAPPQHDSPPRWTTPSSRSSNVSLSHMNSCSTRLLRCGPKPGPCSAAFGIPVHDKIVLILRDKPTQTADNGVSLPPLRSTTKACASRFPICDPSSCWGRMPDRLAGSSSRCAGFRGSCAPCLRPRPRRRSPNRQSAGVSAKLETGGFEGAKSPKRTKPVRISVKSGGKRSGR